MLIIILLAIITYFVFRKKESTGTSTQTTKALKEKPVFITLYA